MAIELAATTDRAIVGSASVLWSLSAGRRIDEQSGERPLFLDVKPGMTVVVRHDFFPGETRDKDWWMGVCLCCSGGARKPEHHNIFQIADVDTGEIRWVNADLVTHIVPSDRWQ